MFLSGEWTFKIFIKYDMVQRHALSPSLVPIDHKYFHSFIHRGCSNVTFPNDLSHIESIVHFPAPFNNMFFSSLMNCRMADRGEDSFISSNLIQNSYINYIKLNASKCFERHPLIFRRSMSLIVHLCSLRYSHSLQVAVLCTC